MRLRLKNKMLAILPEIYRSGIYRKYAGSIVEYAGKYGDIAKTTVIKRLRLEENLENLPFLKAAIEKVGVHKVAMVAKITTPETDRVMADRLQNMSKSAVQSLSRELRTDSTDGKPCNAVPITKRIEMDEQSTFLFLKLKAKIGKNLSDKEFLKIVLEERIQREFPAGRRKKDSTPTSGKVAVFRAADAEFDQKSANEEGPASTVENAACEANAITGSVTGETPRAAENPVGSPNTMPMIVVGDPAVKPDAGLSRPSIFRQVSKPASTSGRYIRIARKREILERTNGRCTYPNCNSPYAVIHHSSRYSESKNHDSAITLCKIHHEFAHNNLIQNELQSADRWKLSVAQHGDVKISRADILYRKYRRKQ